MYAHLLDKNNPIDKMDVGHTERTFVSIYQTETICLLGQNGHISNIFCVSDKTSDTN